MPKQKDIFGFDLEGEMAIIEATISVTKSDFLFFLSHNLACKKMYGLYQSPIRRALQADIYRKPHGYLEIFGKEYFYLIKEKKI